MTFALASVKAYGVEAEEPVNNKYKQCLALSITAANTDTALDLGTYAGTFWSAVGATEPGITALLAIKDIQTRAKSFLGIAGTGVAGKSQVQGGITKLDSSASAGGAATETLTVTGLLTTDVLLAVSQFVKGANGTALIAYGGATGVCSVNGQLGVEWTANPGAGAKLRVEVLRATPVSGQYILSMNGTNGQLPDVTFFSGDAPTSYTVVLTWELKDGEIPVEVAA